MTDHDIERAALQTRKLIAEQAAQWLIAFEESGGTSAERQELAAWLRASPAHAQEFLNAKALWEAMSRESLGALPDASASATDPPSTGDDNVVSLPASRIAGPLGARAAGRSGRRLAVAATAILLAATATFVFERAFKSGRLETGIGEQKTLELADGSSVSLNTRSRIRIEWSEKFRDIRLDEGEALFDVAPDPARPFRVWSGDSLVRALGTRFNVYRGAEGVTVTVLEGRVEVSETPVSSGKNATLRPGSPVRLAAGEQASIRERQPIRTARLAAPERSVAWQTQRLLFEGEPLSQVVREFNRYHETPLVLDDAALGAKRVNGIFDATDRASLIAFLQEFEDVRIEARPEAIVIRRR